MTWLDWCRFLHVFTDIGVIACFVHHWTQHGFLSRSALSPSDDK